jgi:hypothetical protein
MSSVIALPREYVCTDVASLPFGPTASVPSEKVHDSAAKPAVASERTRTTALVKWNILLSEEKFPLVVHDYTLRKS